MKIVFFGSADFGIPALEKLIQSHKVVAVVTTPPKPQGRGLNLRESPVAVFARKHGVASVVTPEDLNRSDFHGELAKYGADIFIVVAYRILPKSLFNSPPLGTLNVHASLLPKYRGPAPIQRAIEAGETVTGVTVFRIDEGVDTGGILRQKKTAIAPDETSIDLNARLSVCGAELLVETLEGLAAGTLRPARQDSAQASRAPKLSKTEARIEWGLPALVICNKIRAFKPFPGSYTLFEGRRLGIEKAQVAVPGAFSPGKAGTVTATGDSFFDVQCSDGNLRVIEVKPEGKRCMSVRDFLSGNRVVEGTCFT